MTRFTWLRLPGSPSFLMHTLKRSGSLGRRLCTIWLEECKRKINKWFIRIDLRRWLTDRLWPFKRKVVQYAENNSNRAAARRHQVDERSVRDWGKQKEQLNTLPSKKQCLPGAGRKPKLPEVKEQLAVWIEHQLAHHLRVTRTMIQQKAIQLHAGEEEFSASRGWLENFLRHHNFSLRRKTTSQWLPQDMIAKVSTFVLRVRKMRLLHQYPISCMDETPLWLDMPGDTTVMRAGECTVWMHCFDLHDWTWQG